mmetsp:Transcript_32799/g.58915  ORF Transcript_32799/g.58915 Transcript_32799/m.58915 type:complete len:252 (-) Transcript_32799:254-1009(-)
MTGRTQTRAADPGVARRLAAGRESIQTGAETEMMVGWVASIQTETEMLVGVAGTPAMAETLARTPAMSKVTARAGSGWTTAPAATSCKVIEMTSRAFSSHSRGGVAGREALGYLIGIGAESSRQRLPLTSCPLRSGKSKHSIARHHSPPQAGKPQKSARSPGGRRSSDQRGRVTTVVLAGMKTVPALGRSGSRNGTSLRFLRSGESSLQSAGSSKGRPPGGFLIPASPSTRGLRDLLRRHQQSLWTLKPWH